MRQKQLPAERGPSASTTGMNLSMICDKNNIVLSDDTARLATGRSNDHLVFCMKYISGC